ncbi:GTP-binding protein Era [hydrothermal vent metagenome]|uniref:GTP-binding protein Era n=2 Tax=hydrothermal vent metagenome TaxID=652676 RepID=A0A3B1CR95_9ZZZZ
MKNSHEKGFRSGYVSILGRPNVGKSTFLNAILGEKVAIVTSKPQTTRNRIIGVRTTPSAQIVFIDTPGIHKPMGKLGEFMVKEAMESLKEVDVVLLMVEPRKPGSEETAIIDLFKQRKNLTVFLLINKIDTIRKAELLPIIEKYSTLYPFDEIIPVSAVRGDGLDIVLGKIIDRLPEGPKYYPDDIFTDQLERFMVAEIIREKIMSLTEEEIPYSVAVEVTQWEEKGDMIVINANIYVEKESQKGIIIGKRGAMLKAIGIASREEIEGLLNTKVYIELWVKVKKDWRKKAGTLRELGYR